MAGNANLPQRKMAPAAMPLGNHNSVAMDCLYGTSKPSFAVTKYAANTTKHFAIVSFVMV
jgi:hypothetical protein